MDFIKRLFGSKSEPGSGELKDPDFGVIWRCDETAWEGETAQLGDVALSVSVSGDDTGPTSDARSLFQSLPSHYAGLAQGAARLIGGSTEQPLSEADLTLDHISIDTNPTPPRIELSFRIPGDPEHSHIVEVREWLAKSTYCS